MEQAGRPCAKVVLSWSQNYRNPQASAIMAIDVIGYSCLMGKDEAGAAREHREAARPLMASILAAR